MEFLARWTKKMGRAIIERSESAGLPVAQWAALPGLTAAVGGGALLSFSPFPSFFLPHVDPLNTQCVSPWGALIDGLAEDQRGCEVTECFGVVMHAQECTCGQV